MGSSLEMASISYPTHLDVPGPWLLDATNLRDLDGVVDSCVVRMKKRQEELVSSAVAKKMKEFASKGLSEAALKQKADELRESVGGTYPLNTKKRSVVAYMTGGRSADGRTFEELNTLPRVNEETPRGFALRAAIADTEITVELAFSEYSRNLKLAVSSPDPDFAQELFGRMENWVSDIQPKRWLQIWLKADFFSFLAVIAILALSMFAAGRVMVTEEGPSQVRQQAFELARQGVNSSNEIRAIQLLLSMESGYEPVPAPAVHNYPTLRFWVYLTLALALLVAFQLPPKGAIGIWGGKRALDAQRRWVRTVSITVPGLLGTSFFIPTLLRLIGLSN
jgi:hypothetical protein